MQFSLLTANLFIEEPRRKDGNIGGGSETLDRGKEHGRRLTED
jgi:hypothetical protein